MNFGRLRIDIALHKENYLVFGILMGYIKEIPAYGLVINLGAGGVIIGWKL